MVNVILVSLLVPAWREVGLGSRWYLQGDLWCGDQGARIRASIYSASPAFAGACCGLLGFDGSDVVGQLGADQSAACAPPWARACEPGSGSYGRPPERDGLREFPCIGELGVVGPTGSIPGRAASTSSWSRVRGLLVYGIPWDWFDIFLIACLSVYVAWGAPPEQVGLPS